LSLGPPPIPFGIEAVMQADGVCETSVAQSCCNVSRCRLMSSGNAELVAGLGSQLRKLMPVSESPFIVSSLVTYKRGLRTISRIRPPRPDSACRCYRCEPVFKRLYEYLRTQGVTANKPLHELRKEIGALIATEHRMFAVSTYELRPASLTHCKDEMLSCRP
jgi:hypothetical protein